MKKKTKTWLELAVGDLTFAKELMDKKGRYHYCAYFCHQAIEKLLKAIISERTEEIPLPVHNFKILLKQAEIDKEIPETRREFILTLASHYIGTKYPEDITKLYRQYTKTFVQKLYQQTQEVFEWLRIYLR